MQGNIDPMTFNMMLNMMNVMHPNMGYNSNNYNYNMNNSTDSMNMMMNWMNMNPVILQMYNNNMFQNNNIPQNYNNNNINLNNSNNGQSNINGGVNDIQNTFDLSKNSNEQKFNVVFIHQTGKKVMMICPYSLIVKDLLLKYISRVGLSDYVIGKEIFFIYNGLKIDEKEEKKIGQYFFPGMLQTILVVDTKNIIGAKSLLLK